MPISQSHAVALPAAAEISGLRSIADDSIRSLEEAGLRNTQEIAISLNAILDRLERLVGDQISKPIVELNATIRSEFSATRATIIAVSQSVKNLPFCASAQAEILAAGIFSGMQATVNNFPLVNGEPIAYLIEDPVKRLPYRVELDEQDTDNFHVIMKGANLWNDGETCGQLAATAVPVNADIAAVPLLVLNADAHKIDLKVPSSLPPGQWQIEVTGASPRFLGCFFGSKKQTVSAGLLAHNPLRANVSVDITPVCPTVDSHSETFSGGLNNGGYNNGRERGSRTLVMNNAGYKLKRFDFNITRNRRGSANATRSGDSVVVRYSATGRGPLGTRSTGRIYWSATLHGERAGEDQNGKAYRTVIDGPLGSGQVAEFSYANDSVGCKTPKAWVISARAEDSSGQLIGASNPTQIVKGNQGLSVGSGLTASFDTNTLKGIVEMAPAACGSVAAP